MTNIYFWGKVISPSFQKSPQQESLTVLSLHTEEIVKTVQSGAQNAFLLTTNNQLYAFGSNEHGQMGLSFYPHKNLELSRIFVPTKTKIVSVSCGWYHTLILDQLGCVYSSGKGSQGAIGQGTRQNSYGFKQIMTNVRKVSAGLDHSLAIKGNKVFGWGNTEDGQLGIHSKKIILSPKQLNVYPCEQIFAGPKYSIFITIKGVYGCGMNNNFQLGLGHDKDLHYPKSLNIEGEIVKIWGGNYCFAKNKNDEVYIWGTGAFGVFKFPTKIPFFQGCEQISLGLNFGIIEKDERVYVWGCNNFGQLGCDSKQIKDYAFECPSLSNLDLVQFKCGGNFTVGISYGEQENAEDKVKTEYGKDEIIQEFYGSEDLEDEQNTKVFKQSNYSSFQRSPKTSQQANIFKQHNSLQNKQAGTSSCNYPKNAKSPNQNYTSSSHSQKQHSTSDQTVKKMMPLNSFNRNSLKQASNKQLEKDSQYRNYDPEIKKLAEEMEAIRLQMQLKSRRNHELDQENSYLKQVIMETFQGKRAGGYNQSKSSQRDREGSRCLKDQYHSINQLVRNNPYLRNLLGMEEEDRPQQIHEEYTNNAKDIQQFGLKLLKLKEVMQQVVQNSQSQRSSFLGNDNQ